MSQHSYVHLLKPLSSQSKPSKLKPPKEILSASEPHPSTDRFMRIAVVLDRVGVSSSTLYSWMAEGLFPQQIKIGRTSVWSENEIYAWMDQQKEANL